MQRFRVRGVEDLQKAQDGDEFHLDEFLMTCAYFPTGWIRVRTWWIHPEGGRFTDEELIEKHRIGVVVRRSRQRKWINSNRYSRLDVTDVVQLAAASPGDLLSPVCCDSELSCFRRVGDGWSFGGKRRYTDEEALDQVKPYDWESDKPFAVIWQRK